MTSFFALATIVALAVAPSAMANLLRPGAQPIHFLINLRDNLAFGVTNGRPLVPGEPLVIAEVGSDSLADPTVFFLLASGNIRLIGGFPDQPLCVSGSRINGKGNRPGATIDRCDLDDPAQLWFVRGYDATTIYNVFGDCITVRGNSPSVGDQVTIEPCEIVEPGPEQLWNVVGAYVL